MSKLSLLFVVALAPIAATACGTSEAASEPSDPATATKASTSTDDLYDLCIESFTRNRTCTAEYIPALVDARARHDKPAGITQAVAEDRAGVIAQANAEWAEDGKDENIAATCTRMKAAPPSPMMEDAAGVIRGCLQQADCAGWVACSMPVVEPTLK